MIENGDRPGATTSAQSGGGGPYFDVINVSKYFGRIRALRDVDVSFREGECVGLVGDNGAGKSTLVRILGGQYTPDVGSIYVDGVAAEHWSVANAQRAGVTSVAQDLNLCDEFDASANVFLNDELTRWQIGRLGWIDKAGMTKKSFQLLESFGASIPSWWTKVERLSGGQRQAIAIARALRNQPRILLLDEPTAALGIRQSSAVLSAVRRLADQGIGVVLISHNIEQVLSVCDRLVCLFQGRLTLDSPVSDLNRDQIVAAMMGSDK